MKVVIRLFKISSCLLLTWLFACEEPVELNLDAVMPQVVVDGSFTSNQPFQIILSRSRDILSNASPEFIDNATITIQDANNAVLGTLGYFEDTTIPVYRLDDIVPEVGELYQLTIEIPNYPIIVAQDRIPMPTPLDVFSVDVTHREEGEMMISSVAVTTEFKDQPQEKNFYHLQLYHKIVNGRESHGFVNNDEEHLAPLPISAINNHEVNNLFVFNENGVLFADEVLDGQNIQLVFRAQLDAKTAGIEPEVIGELRSVSESYYKYHTSIARQRENNGRPFTEPISIFSNIENGLGFFAGFSTYRDSVTVVQ